MVEQKTCLKEQVTCRFVTFNLLIRWGVTERSIGLEMCTQIRYTYDAIFLGSRQERRKLALKKVDFAEAIGIFDDPFVIEAEDDRIDYGETRIHALGTIDEISYFVVYTWRVETRHIITAWKVGKASQKRYRDLLSRRHHNPQEEG
jgi:uncharacterized DUF497 family protein